MPTPPPGTASSLHDAVLDALGADIIDGRLVAGDRLRLEDVQARFDVSRTVARDVIRTLESLGFVEARRRVGITVRCDSEWNMLSPRVVRWRLHSGEREAQFRDITELRAAVEPIAAARAACRASDEARERIVHLAAELRRLGEAGELEPFLEADIEFHNLLLRESGNRQFGAMCDAVATAPTERTRQHRMPFQPRPEALRQHEAVAQAVADGDAAGAARAAAAIVDEVVQALVGGTEDACADEVASDVAGRIGSQTSA